MNPNLALWLFSLYPNHAICFVLFCCGNNYPVIIDCHKNISKFTWFLQLGMYMYIDLFFNRITQSLSLTQFELYALLLAEMMRTWNWRNIQPYFYYLVIFLCVDGTALRASYPIISGFKLAPHELCMYNPCDWDDVIRIVFQTSVEQLAHTAITSCLGFPLLARISKWDTKWIRVAQNMKNLGLF